MARIAKSDIHAALRRAADHLLDAAGPDLRVSRADVKQKLATLDGTERALVDLFFRFVDYRDYEEGATVTVKDVEAAYEYATENLIDAYDKNDNGLADSEIAKMSTIGKLAVAFALELAEQQPTVDIAEADPSILESQITALIDGLTLISNSDAGFRPIVVPLAPYATLDIDTVRQLFASVHTELGSELLGRRAELFDLEQAYAEERDFGEWFVQRRMPEELDDPLAVERAVRTGELVDFLAANVSEPRVFAYSDQATSTDQPTGAVSVFILGRTPAGWLIGVYTASVES